MKPKKPRLSLNQHVILDALHLERYPLEKEELYQRVSQRHRSFQLTLDSLVKRRLICNVLRVDSTETGKQTVYMGLLLTLDGEEQRKHSAKR